MRTKKAVKQAAKPAKTLLEIRSAEKAASRAEDEARIKAGVSPAQIQQENSVFSGRVLSPKSISNLADAMSK